MGEVVKPIFQPKKYSTQNGATKIKESRPGHVGWMGGRGWSPRRQLRNWSQKKARFRTKMLGLIIITNPYSYPNILTTSINILLSETIGMNLSLKIT